MCKALLSKLADFDKVQIPRCPIPSDEESNSGIRLLCLSDAAHHAGGAAVYAGSGRVVELFVVSIQVKDHAWTIPRNELSAILLMAELAFICKRALGSRVREIIYATDSTIALAWCHNHQLKLRVWTHSSVETILRLIEWTVYSGSILLYHIDTKINIADILTKPREVAMSDVSMGSHWQDGFPWMKLSTASMPIHPYKAITVPRELETDMSKECFADPTFLDLRSVNWVTPVCTQTNPRQTNPRHDKH